MPTVEEIRAELKQAITSRFPHYLTQQRYGGRKRIDTSNLWLPQTKEIIASKNRRPHTIFNGQYADLSLEKMCELALKNRLDGIELCCWGPGGIDVKLCAKNPEYAEKLRNYLEQKGLKLFAISDHLTGQAVHDPVNGRLKQIVSKEIWGDDTKDHAANVSERAIEQMILVGKAAKNLGVRVVNGFTGGGKEIWPQFSYDFPPKDMEALLDDYIAFRNKWMRILDKFEKDGVKFALEVHPTEVAFDIPSWDNSMIALSDHPAYGINFDPSHMVHQRISMRDFLLFYADRIFHVHAKDAFLSEQETRGGKYRSTPWTSPDAGSTFRSVGKGSVDFEELVRFLNTIGYWGPLSIEWEDEDMQRERGLEEAANFLRDVDHIPPLTGFEAAFTGGGEKTLSVAEIIGFKNKVSAQSSEIPRSGRKKP